MFMAWCKHSNINHNPLDWRFFIDSSKSSFKAVLLHNNTLPSIPVGHSVHNESHENVKILMEVINYDKFKWQICGDLKWLPFYLDYNKDSQNIVALFANGTAELGLFITQRIGLARKYLELGIMNVENQPLVEPSKILLPSMHLKLRLMKNFVKTLNQVPILTRKVPENKWGTIERRYFHWSTNTRPYQGRILRQAHSRRRKAAWDSFKFVVKGFLKNRRAQNYEELLNNLLQSYQKLGCNMSLKIHFFTRIWIFS